LGSWDCRLHKKHVPFIVQASSDLKMLGCFLTGLNARLAQFTSLDMALSAC